MAMTFFPIVKNSEFNKKYSRHAICNAFHKKFALPLDVFFSNNDDVSEMRHRFITNLVEESKP